MVERLVQDFCIVFNSIAKKTKLSDLDKTIFEDSFSENTHLVTSIMDEIRPNLAWAIENQDIAKTFISRIIKLGRKYSFPILRCKMGSILLILRFSSAAQYQSFQEAEMRGFVDRNISELLLQPEYIEIFGLSRGEIDVEIERSRELVLPGKHWELHLNSTNEFLSLLHFSELFFIMIHPLSVSCSSFVVCQLFTF